MISATTENIIKTLTQEQIREIAIYYAHTKRYKGLNAATDIKIYIEDLMGLKDFFQKTRKKEYVLARWLYYYAMRNLTDLSLEDIGHPQDHSTVIYALKQVDIIRDYDKGWRNQYLRKIDVFILKQKL